ncbi:hypothetical protein [Azospirillum doebereinerae]
MSGKRHNRSTRKATRREGLDGKGISQNEIEASRFRNVFDAAGFRIR